MNPNWQILHELCNRMYAVSKWKDEVSHAHNTLEWLLKINPESTEAMKIAAFAHDIERTFINKRSQKPNELHLEHKIEHSKRSADIVCTIMFTLNFKQTDFESVYFLISNHEIGGDQEANDVRDADSLSFFENNLIGYYSKHGKETTENKVKFMYARSSEIAQSLVKSINFNTDMKQLINNTLDLNL